MKNDLIVTTEDSFMEGAMSSFPASDPPSYMAGVAIWAHRPLRWRSEASPRFDSPFTCHGAEFTESQGVSKHLARRLDEAARAFVCRLHWPACSADATRSRIVTGERCAGYVELYRTHWAG